MVHIRISTKMSFLENRPKMPQLHGPITFSKMVVRGWYMPHFDRRDLLDSKKQVWGGFRNLPGLYGPISEIFSIFSEISPGQPRSKKVIFLTSESEKMIENYFFFKFFETSKKYGTSAPEWYIYIGRTPNRSGARVF